MDTCIRLPTIAYVVACLMLPLVMFGCLDRYEAVARYEAPQVVVHYSEIISKYHPAVSDQVSWKEVEELFALLPMTNIGVNYWNLSITKRKDGMIVVQTSKIMGPTAGFANTFYFRHRINMWELIEVRRIIM